MTLCMIMKLPQSVLSRKAHFYITLMSTTIHVSKAWKRMIQWRFFYFINLHVDRASVKTNNAQCYRNEFFVFIFGQLLTIAFRVIANTYETNYVSSCMTSSRSRANALQAVSGYSYLIFKTSCFSEMVCA